VTGAADEPGGASRFDPWGLADGAGRGRRFVDAAGLAEDAPGSLAASSVVEGVGTRTIAGKVGSPVTGGPEAVIDAESAEGRAVAAVADGFA
jgi:hypothetical protein